MSNKVQEFLESITVLDTETTGLEYDSDEIVEIGGARFVDNDWQITSTLLGCHKRIPPEASAVHHISNKMVSGLQKFQDRVDFINDEILRVPETCYFVAHNAEFDREMIKAAYQRSGAAHKFKSHATPVAWLCTWRLSKAILNINYEKMKYSLGFLRYLLELEVPDNFGGHRVDSDIMTCGKLIEMLIELATVKGQLNVEESIGPQLYTLANAPAYVETWPFGKHRGKKLEDIPSDYFFWAIDNMDSLKEGSGKYDRDLAESIKKVLENRL